MKKLLYLIPIALIFLIAPAAFAGTPFLGSTTIYYNGTFTSGTVVTGSNSLTDGSNTTFRQFTTNNYIAGYFGGKKNIDAWTARTATVGTFPFTLQLYANDGTTVVSSIDISINNNGSSGTISPNVVAYYYKLINKHTSTVSVGEFNLQDTPDTTAPNPPTASATGGNLSVTVTWSKPTAVDLAGYKIYRSGTLVNTITNPNTLSYTQTGLTPGTTYQYAVSAYDDAAPANESATSATVSAVPTDTIAPTTPGSLTATPADNAVLLSWNASTDNHLVSGYRIRRNGTQIATTSATNYTATGLTNFTAYTFTVAAYDATPNVSSAATIESTPVDNVAPTMPTPTSGTIGETTAEINFFDSSSSDVVKYTVSRDNFVSFFDIPDNNSSVYSYTFTGMSSSTPYTISVKSTDDDGNVSTVKTLDITTTAVPPAVPSGLYVTSSDNTLTYTWTANTESDLSGYKIKLSTAATADNVAINSYQITGLTNGFEKCYQIASYDIWGNTSAYSTAVCGTPTDSLLPDAPVLTASAGNLLISLSWTASTAADVSYYEIYKIVSGSPVLDFTFPDATVKNKDYPTAYNVTSTYAVKSVDDDGNKSVLSNIVSMTAVDTIPPSQPTSLSATAGDRSVSLSWTASTDNNVVSGYQVIYKIVTATGETIATTTSTSYTATGLTNNQTYGFNVKAFDPAGNLSAAAYIESTPVDTVAPYMKPLVLDSKTETSVTLTFDESTAADVVKYTITKNDFVNAADIPDTNAGNHSYTFSGLNGNTLYTFKIKATDDDGNVSTVKTLAVTTAADPPDTPTGLSVTELDNKLTYNWTANTESDLAGYKIYLVSSGTLVATTTATTADITGLVNGVQKCYQVAAIDIWNNLSGKSAAVCGTPVDIVPPFDVTTISSSGSTEYSYTFIWDDSTSPDVDYYKIYKDTVYIDDVSDVPGQSTYAYTATGLTPGVSYSFNVNPVDDDGWESYPGTSGTISGMTTGVAPNAPSGFSATPGTDKITFTWTANTESDLDGYKLYKSSGGSYVLLNSYGSAVTTAEITTSDPTAFSYVLAAYDIGGTVSSYSTAVTVAPISSSAPLFGGLTSPISAGDIVDSGLSVVGMFKWLIILGLAIWLVYKLLYLMRNANQTPQTAGANVEEKPVKRRRTKQEIEADRKIKKEIREEKERINKIKSNVRSKLSKSVGFKIYKKD